MDQYYRGVVSLNKQRDQLWYKQHMCTCFHAFHPVAKTYYANILSPIDRWRSDKDRWVVHHDGVLEYRFDEVWIPAASKDYFDKESTRYFDMNPPKNELYNVDRPEYGVPDPVAVSQNTLQ